MQGAKDIGVLQITDWMDQQATAETCDLSPPHAPREEAIKSFKELEHDLKRELVHLRHEHDKHEKEYFQAVVSLTVSYLPSLSSFWRLGQGQPDPIATRSTEQERRQRRADSH